MPVLSFSGAAEIADFSAIKDGQKLLGWEKGTVQDFRFSPWTALEIGRLDIENPVLSWVVDKKETSNLKDLFAAGSVQDGNRMGPARLVIETINLTNGTLSLTVANSLVGVLSAVVDNIPVMFAVLTMYPEMDETQWLLVTLTAGVGGSLLSIGSAAGVALMGQARGQYTFFSHLKWTPVIFLGYAASIFVHLHTSA